MPDFIAERNIVNETKKRLSRRAVNQKNNGGENENINGGENFDSQGKIKMEAEM